MTQNSELKEKTEFKSEPIFSGVVIQKTSEGSLKKQISFTTTEWKRDAGEGKVQSGHSITVISDTPANYGKSGKRDRITLDGQNKEIRDYLFNAFKAVDKVLGK